MVNACYSPPWDGCKPVLHAATVPLEQMGSPENPDLRYFSRGLFNHPILLYLDGTFGKDAKFAQNLIALLWGPTAMTCTLMDWPLRKLFCRMAFCKTKCVRSSSKSYDEGLAQRLWDLSAEIAHLPTEPPIFLSIFASS
ncbi:hypothetical protein DUNSADRAFT_18771 [Dunaliella salina]|uniref:Encoded protein n=1 Tax=Dunaliella salina TaxID=3046 RepID=A0ABQ7FZJ8_DUNSA|nr:hypothetical protein DUNSADRAFT_18771 [Dunaliella salina]|eukprot:KAF5827779.1 hypothetical protein DUNSADRAFT_18771 [Dunaliella salina]